MKTQRVHIECDIILREVNLKKSGAFRFVLVCDRTQDTAKRIRAHLNAFQYITRN